ncbi:hypothetical protein [Nostoc sp.]|uniref:hypothetical protein n=1 Tax=Nostoc sp. TaxID=1180 RepID=UPI002FEFED41
MKHENLGKCCDGTKRPPRRSLRLIEREFDGTKKWQEVVQANLLGKYQSKVF